MSSEGQRILKTICSKHGCSAALTSTGDVEGAPPIGEMYCFYNIDPKQVLSQTGCQSATTFESSPHQGGDNLHFGKMKKTGFIANNNSTETPTDHPRFGNT